VARSSPQTQCVDARSKITQDNRLSLSLCVPPQLYQRPWWEKPKDGSSHVALNVTHSAPEFGTHCALCAIEPAPDAPEASPFRKVTSFIEIWPRSMLDRSYGKVPIDWTRPMTRKRTRGTGAPFNRCFSVEAAHVHSRRAAAHSPVAPAPPCQCQCIGPAFRKAHTVILE
jgi:hypothetical protein